MRSARAVRKHSPEDPAKPKTELARGIAAAIVLSLAAALVFCSPALAIEDNCSAPAFIQAACDRPVARIEYDCIVRTYSASSQSYGASEIGFRISGLEETDSVSVSVSGRNAGEYKPDMRIIRTDGDTGEKRNVTGEYAIYSPGTPALKIVPYDGKVTVTLHDQTMNFGQAVPSFSATVSGELREGDLKYTTYRDGNLDAGIKAIGASSSDANYSNVSVNKATLTIRPMLTYSYQGSVPAKAPSSPPSTFVDFETRISVRKDPSLAGYSFSGWKSSQVSGASFAISPDHPFNEIRFTGTWTAKTYTVSYFLDNVPYRAYETKTDDEVKVPPTPSREGYSFSGWHGVPDVMPAQDLRFYATFEAIPYKVSWVLDGEEYRVEYRTIGQVIDRIADPPMTQGWLFTGWDYDGVPDFMATGEYVIKGSTYPVVPVDLTGGDSKTLAWGNLGMAVLGLAAMAAATVRHWRRKLDFSPLMAVYALPSIASFTLLLLTADSGATLTASDIWSPMFGLMLAMQAFFAYRLYSERDFVEDSGKSRPAIQEPVRYRLRG